MFLCDIGQYLPGFHIAPDWEAVAVAMSLQDNFVSLNDGTGHEHLTASTLPFAAWFAARLALKTSAVKVSGLPPPST